MNDVFHEYMSKRLDEINLNDYHKEPGPVVTLSRVAGCSASNVSNILASSLTELTPILPWKVISKEILRESARELEIHPKKIKEIYKGQNRSLMDEIAQAILSNQNQLERKFRKTIIDVFLRFAYEGNKIFIGRGSNIICSQIKKALHVRIDAPLEWRIHRVMTQRHFSRDEALTCITSTEKNRADFRKSIKGKTVFSEDYDLTINQSKFSDEEIAQIIIKTLSIRNII
ncbi:MAG TPA: cytidylate kinase-like family protein [Prolixibacteraceae bacterium]|nr:cytidylate kinase-like family protein [Prolixibacteraceae bacterium]